ncbi:MAG: PIN domain-containing protein [Calditrichaeota bacterium]|nr:MAG: PIN domain-containing protein [Calditrichota bacterium]MBL1204340.1 PIN domain-containing protein [Calditrichota bacterium]NOG44169.1 type II toxin-antitoxin system VapC family toxin [Calditrichota bacterium]
MTGIDTNLLVRFLVNDDEIQAKEVLRIFKNAERKKDYFFVSILVTLELIWVLKAVYNLPREQIVLAIESLISMPILKLEKLDAIHKMVSESKQKSNDLSDLLIAHCSFLSGCEKILTFDKRAAKHNLFKQI